MYNFWVGFLGWFLGLGGVLFVVWLWVGWFCVTSVHWGMLVFLDCGCGGMLDYIIMVCENGDLSVDFFLCVVGGVVFGRASFGCSWAAVLVLLFSAICTFFVVI
jgi:hypothetical protein